ncbi:aminodeoxychorismate synthase component I [Vibrio hannami]|uniref:aminodeoxychorismate synthase component I n=1 Tax=Vibrio hannami TaxID=2717094 RepID=UPI00240FA7BB|nr:aminodeoxychorismate synthase component I [Vibrio hannami]MDG3088197.1 aminodeoxychorismate synthase component I [Vibrio hannami]
MNNNTNHKLETKNLNYSPEIAQQLFAPISHLPWAMLLRSASEEHPDSRYDILVANPIATIETTGDISEIVTPEGTSESNADPFSLIDNCIKNYLPETPSVENLPFVGGALGYFAYDLGRRVEKLPNIARRDIDIPDMVVGIYDWAIIVDHKLCLVTAVGEDVESNYQWLTQQRSIFEAQNESHPPFKLESDWHSNMLEHEYQKKIESVHEYLLSGDCYQINLTQRFKAKYTGNEWDTYLKLEHTNKAPFSAFIRTNNCAILSLSPERFLQLSDCQIETKPIKGTRPRHTDPNKDQLISVELQNAEKDQAENLMIVDLLRNDIGRVAKAGSVSVPHLFEIESFPAVHHLVSTIEATLDDNYNACDLLRACFPGGSITGAPKVRAMEIIEELEPHRRSVYCGSIGYISRCGTMDTSITIRTLIANNECLYAWAGGGIVADSRWESEYQETYDKLSKILPVLKN